MNTPPPTTARATTGGGAKTGGGSVMDEKVYPAPPGVKTGLEGGRK